MPMSFDFKAAFSQRFYIGQYIDETDQPEGRDVVELVHA